MRKSIVTIALIVMLFNFCLSFSNVYASDILTVDDFNDIPSTHWGLEAISWGLENGIMGGYPDRTFQPDKTVTEAEFVKMLVDYATNIDATINSEEKKHWSQPYYDKLADFEIPLTGYYYNHKKDFPIERVEVAMAISSFYGFNILGESSTYFLYENELSKGKTGVMNYNGFSPHEHLTRAEIAQFLYNMSKQDKEKTFLGKQSRKGYVDAYTILGSSLLPIDVTPVDFSNFGAPPEEVSGIKTAVIGDKVVVTEMNKITTPTVSLGDSNLKYMNYFDYDATERFNGSTMNNSIAKINGVELPRNKNFKSAKGMNDGGLVNIELDGSESTAGSFTDKEVFKALLPNLSYFSASKEQLKIAEEMVDTWYQKTDPKNVIYLPVNSKSKNSAMLIRYGNGDVSVTMYNKSGVADGMGTPITVE